MSTKVSSSSSGVGFAGLLTIAFVVLKLIGTITWPWVWVLAPMWGSIVLLFTIILVMAVIAAIINW